MFAGAQGETLGNRGISDVDIMKDVDIFDSSSILSAAVGSSIRDAQVTVFRNNNPPKFGLRQPHIKAPGRQVTILKFNPYDPLVLFVGTADGVITLWKIPENGLRGDLNAPTAKFDCGGEIKCAAWHPIAKNLIAVGSRSGHVQIFDEKLSAPAIDLEHTRPLNAVAWSDDGLLIFALHVDMVLRVWDVRTKAVLGEVKTSPTRGVGTLTSLPGRRVLLSFSDKGKQIGRIYNEKLEEVSARNFKNSGTPATFLYHPAGVIISYTTREPTVSLINPDDLSDISSFQGETPITSAAIEVAKPVPDQALFCTLTCVSNSNTVFRIGLNLDGSVLPATYENFPTFTTDLDAAAWLGGENGSLKTEKIFKEVTEEAKQEVQDDGPKGPGYLYKFLSPSPDPPRNFFINLPVSTTPAHEFNEICTNGKQFAFVNCDKTPQIIVLPLDKPQKCPAEPPTICDPHSTGIAYMEFSPHNPQKLATCGEDAKAKIWTIPADFKAKDKVREPDIVLPHKRKVNIVKWCQSTRNLVVTSSMQTELVLWDLNTEQRARDFSAAQPFPIQDLTFDSLGTNLFTIHRDGKFRMFDPRAQDAPVVEILAHPGGARHRRILYMADLGLIATFGGSKKGWRECNIYDPKKFDQQLKTIEIDDSTSSMLPMYEEGSGVIYLGGKGDGHIRFLEICNDERVIACNGIYESADPARGLCLLPRTSCDVMKCESSRMLKLGNEAMYQLHWFVPRTNPQYFQDAIFLPIRNTTKPLFEIVDYFGGNADVWPMINFQPPGTQLASKFAPKVKTQGKYDFKKEREAAEKPVADRFTIEGLLETAVEISTSSDDAKDESDSW